MKVYKLASFCSIKHKVNIREEDNKATATNTTKETPFLTLVKSQLKQEQGPLMEDLVKEESLCGYPLGLQSAIPIHGFIALSQEWAWEGEEAGEEKVQQLRSQAFA